MVVCAKLRFPLSFDNFFLYGAHNIFFYLHLPPFDRRIRCGYYCIANLAEHFLNKISMNFVRVLYMLKSAK